MLDSRGRKNRSTVAIAAISATREKEGKLLYSAKCGRILRERGQYQMLDGVAAKRLDDHLLDGMFKGIMSLRFAKEKSSSGENNEMPLQGLRQFLSQDFFGG